MNDGRTSKLGRRSERAVGWLSLVERYFTGTLIIVMTGLYTTNIFVRAVFPRSASSFAWIDEATRYMMVWVVFTAAGIALELGRHVSVNIAHDYLPPRVLPVLFKLVHVIGFVFSLGIAWFSFSLVVFVAGTGQVSPTLGVPTYILYLAPCIGFASLSLRYLLYILGLHEMRGDADRPVWLGSGHV